METAQQIERFREFLDSEENLQKTHNIVNKGEGSLIIDFMELSKFDVKLSEDLLDNPDETFKAMETAATNLDLGINFKIRFFNLPESQTIKIKDIRAKNLGKLVCFDGIVRQASDVRPQVTTAKFECPSCGNTISILQIDTKFKEPYRCSCGKRGGFRMLSKDLIDCQRLVLEESPDTLDGGEQPKRISVFLKEDLVEPKMEKRTTPGTKIRAMGIVKEVPILSRTGGTSTRFDLIMDCNFIIPIEETYDEIILNDKEKKEIEKLAQDQDIYQKWIDSIAPSISGHENIKEALVLQMMSGVKKERADGTMARGDMHVLLIGDPGSGKSTMLSYMVKAAPRSRYVAGKSTTSAGITASVVKDEFLRGWALEAGALVLANKGMCMLDEMDKMSEEDTGALHEAMAQQQITISKANIQAQLKAETTILAAANPKYGRFDPYQPIASQISMPPALINRFDLIFPIHDKPERTKDIKIAKHVLDLHMKKNTIKQPIPFEIIKKYISYVKQNVFPTLTPSAAQEIEDFYVSLRNDGNNGNDDELKPIPITARQLEALVRLSEASARVRLSKSVTKQDARRAIRILKSCLMAVGFDKDSGKIDIDKIATGISTSDRNKINIVQRIITKFSDDGIKTINVDDIIFEASKKEVVQGKVEEVIEQMKRKGQLFEPKKGFIRLI